MNGQKLSNIWAWRSDMNAPAPNLLAPQGPRPEMRSGPAPTLRDMAFDYIYGKLGGTPDQRSTANALTNLADFATLGVPTGVDQGMRDVASGAGPFALGMALVPGARGVGAAENVAARALGGASPRFSARVRQYAGDNKGRTWGLRTPMDVASRNTRGSNLGFDMNTIWYHGSPVSGMKQIELGRRDPGAWFTTDKMNASSYAKGSDAAIYEVRLRSKNPYVVDFEERGGKLVPVHNGNVLEFTDNVDIVRHAQKLGHDAVHFPGGNFTESGNTMVVLNPNNIRSVDAVFDQKRTNSPNILASLAGVLGLGGYAAASGQSSGLYPDK